MPEFHINLGSDQDARVYLSLDEFTQGYIEAAFFTSSGTGDDAENGLEDASFAELAPETLAAVIADCKAWQEKNSALLDSVYGVQGKYEKAAYDAQRAGNDYWYTRNGHGTGFWDRGLGDAGESLAQACRYRELTMVRGDDGLIYFEG